MNWPIFLDNVKWIVFWFFLIYGLVAGANGTFGAAKPTWHIDWRERLVHSIVFVVCMLIFARVVLG